jgi:phosphatidylglycerol---prolipoprotein diacylglyceryl transferase
MAIELNWQYTALMLLAGVVCAWLLRRSQSQLDLLWWQKISLGVGAFIGAMIGAKLPFALADWEGLKSGLVWFSHGKTILSGLVGGYLGVEYTKWCFGIRIKTGDTFAVPVAVGVAIGRIACFFGGCCYGRPTDLPWGCVFPNAGEPHVARHPTQLYEALFHLSLAVVLFSLQRRGLFRGQLMKLYILIYLGYRFATEWIRPEPEFVMGLTAYQVAIAFLIPVFVILWRRDQSAFHLNHFSVD